MNELEATRLKLKCLEMVEGTSVKWWECLCYLRRYSTPTMFTREPMLNDRYENYLIALGILEGKPVFSESYVYLPHGLKVKAGDLELSVLFASGSWSPPKPTPTSNWKPIPVRATYARHKQEHAERMAALAEGFFDAKKMGGRQYVCHLS